MNYWCQGKHALTTHYGREGEYLAYTSEEIDFLAGYLAPEGAWVVIPVEALEGRRTVHVYPREREGQGCYANYREAWCQFACVRRGYRREGVRVGPHCG